MSYLQLGNVQLDLITWLGGFEAGYGYAYASHDIIEGKSHLQWTGDQLETRALSAQLHARFCDPRAEFEKLKTAASRHNALAMFFANGTYEGRFVIEELQRTLERTDRFGNVYLMQVRIQLKEWAEPTSSSLAGSLNANARAQAEAIAENAPARQLKDPSFGPTASQVRLKELAAKYDTFTRQPVPGLIR
ncbi:MULTISPECIES: phage tail protein [Methylococcus]|uniref:Conserved domain protein n=1 Tax=Methylococcus capsulatus (strain ATCC 33009 / NCIMB 11132 / Bath) TaxID=243233 RepID=Q602Z4_METCA|nr:phage tail protein [Methylococcus capsulatus]AAU91014.1 conserved domain protein [Methylococcus capsulatus str. Bath]QXP93054.1 phage tail protein [Methylococcus capsulatus]